VTLVGLHLLMEEVSMWHWNRHTTLDRTPQDERSVHRTDFCLTNPQTFTRDRYRDSNSQSQQVSCRRPTLSDAQPLRSAIWRIPAIQHTHTHTHTPYGSWIVAKRYQFRFVRSWWNAIIVMMSHSACHTPHTGLYGVPVTRSTVLCISIYLFIYHTIKNT